MKFYLRDLKEFDLELADLFADFEDDDIYDEANDKILNSKGEEIGELWDLIWETADSKFIYYNEADEYLKDYNIWEEIKEFNGGWGYTPRNQCDLATFVWHREIGNLVADAIKDAEFNSKELEA